MIRIAICDDLDFYIKQLRELLERYDWKEEHSVSAYQRGDELVQDIRAGKEYDIIFMDVRLQMEEHEVLGTDVGMRIKKHNPYTLIIYMSSYDAYYIDMVQAEPFKFIEKPIDERDLVEVLEKACLRINTYRTKYDYNYIFNGEMHTLNLSEVSYFYSFNRKVYAHMNDGKEVFFYKKIDEVENEINDICYFFARANKSYLVNLRSVKNITHKKLTTMNNISISITQKYRDDFLKKAFSVIFSA